MRDRRSGEGDDATRIDVRREPVVVRDGCAPDRIPPGRWVADRALVRSEQFAVNEAMTLPRSGLLAVHAPAGTGTAEVCADLIAAIVTERARKLAELPDPADAFGEPRPLGAHRVSTPAAALTGFEIVLAGARPQLARVGERWRDRVAEVDYFGSTSRLAGGDGLLLAAGLGDQAANRAFAGHWWRGAARGTDVLFPAGEPMAAALRRLKSGSVDWLAEVGRFRAALAKVAALATERSVVAASLTRLSCLEQACEEASSALEAAQSRLAEDIARESAARDAVRAAGEHRRECLADLAEHELARPTVATITPAGAAALRDRWLPVAVAGGLRRGRNLRNWSVARRALRAACAEATRRRDAALAGAEWLRAELAVARAAVADATREVARIAAEMGPLAEAIGAARQRWGDHVPDGPSQAETEDAALIEWRETCAPWGDEEYATARTEAFLAALALHKALITARADVFEANLDALADLACGQSPPSPGPADAAAMLAAWQSFFLVVPVLAVSCGKPGAPLAGLGPGSTGWLLATSAGQLPPEVAQDAPHRASRAVFAGDAVLATAGSAQHLADQAARYGTWLPADPASGTGRQWVGTPLRLVRGQDRTTIDLRNDLAYDGLLIPDRDYRD